MKRKDLGKKERFVFNVNTYYIVCDSKILVSNEKLGVTDNNLGVSESQGSAMKVWVLQ